MKPYKKMIVLIAFALAITILLSPIMLYESAAKEVATLINGVLNTSTLDFDKGLYILKGEVAVTANKLVDPVSDTFGSAVFESMPYAWKAKDGVTHGSYQFKLEGLQKGRAYGFYLLEALTSYEVFVDGVSIARLGKPNPLPELTVPESKVQSAIFTAKSDTANVVIHVAGRSSHLIGLWQKTAFGPMEMIHAYEVKAKVSDAFVNGAILFMTLFLWILYLIMPEDKAKFYFALASTFVTVKSLYSGQQLGFVSYPLIGYGIGLRIAYLMVPAIAVTFMAFAGECFKDMSNKRLQKYFFSASAIQIAAILLLPQSMYQETFVFYQIMIIFAALLVLTWAIRAVRAGMEGADVYTFGYLVFFATAINDILYSMLLIDTGYYLSFGLFVLILTQAAILALRMRRAIQTEAYMKTNLESLVDERTKELELEKNKFENLSKVDSLTLLYNKGYMSEVLQYEFESFKRYHGALSVLMLDLDHFKVVNDTYGHVKGDEVLQKIADVLKEHSRRTDIIGRFGGEEFLIVLRFTALDDAMKHAEQLRRYIEGIQFEHLGKAFSITTSIGVSSATEMLLDDRQLIHEADEALYNAKKNGRNCVVSFLDF